MMGSIFAGTEESPGKKFKLKKLYKLYRGMGLRSNVPDPLKVLSKAIRIKPSLFLKVLKAEYCLKAQYLK